MGNRTRCDLRIEGLPSMPRFRTARALRKLSKRDLAERCWAADVNHEGAAYSASEAWARVFELVEMIEGARPVDTGLLARLKGHREHIVACRIGSCEWNFHALIRAGLDTAPSTVGRADSDAAPQSPQGKAAP